MDTRPPPNLLRPDHAVETYVGKLFTVWQWRQELFDQSTQTFESLSRPDTVLVLPITQDGQILFADEQQPGMKPMLRSFGGRVEKRESPDAAVRRELLEEAQFMVTDLRLWIAWQPVNKIDWAVYLYVAHGAIIPPQENEMKPDPGERIQTRSFPIAKIFEETFLETLSDPEVELQVRRLQGCESRRRSLQWLFTPFKIID